MEDNKKENENNVEETVKEELDVEDLENVSGGSLRDAHTRRTSSASSSSKSRI